MRSHSRGAKPRRSRWAFAVMGVVLALVLGAAPASAVDYRPAQTLANNKCLDIADGGTSSLVQVWDCNGRYWQTWNYISLGGNLYQIKSGMAGVNRCLTSRGHGGHRWS